jgi:p-hydroxybenzoate 3-monooxygenase
VTLDDKVENGSDDRFWSELKARHPCDIADAIVTGASIGNSIVTLRSRTRPD